MKIRTSYKNGIVVFGVLCLILGFFLYGNMIKTIIYPAYNGLVGKRLEKSIDSYKRINTESYNIYYSDEGIYFDEEIFGDYGERVLNLFRLDNYRVIDVIMHSNREIFHDLIGISLDRPTHGAYFGGKINILYDDSEIIDNIFVHELTHYAVDVIAKGNYPIWFTEGIALYMEYHILDYEWGAELEDVSYLSIVDLNHNFYNLDEYIAYRRSFEIIKYIIDRYGIEKLNDFLRDLGKGKNFARTLRRYYGYSLYKY